MLLDSAVTRTSMATDHFSASALHDPKSKAQKARHNHQGASPTHHSPHSQGICVVRGQESLARGFFRLSNGPEKRPKRNDGPKVRGTYDSPSAVIFTPSPREKLRDAYEQSLADITSAQHTASPVQESEFNHLAITLALAIVNPCKLSFLLILKKALNPTLLFQMRPSGM